MLLLRLDIEFNLDSASILMVMKKSKRRIYSGISVFFNIRANLKITLIVMTNVNENC